MGVKKYCLLCLLCFTFSACLQSVDLEIQHTDSYIHTHNSENYDNASVISSDERNVAIYRSTRFKKCFALACRVTLPNSKDTEEYIVQWLHNGTNYKKSNRSKIGYEILHFEETIFGTFDCNLLYNNYSLVPGFNASITVPPNNNVTLCNTKSWKRETVKLGRTAEWVVKRERKKERNETSHVYKCDILDMETQDIIDGFHCISNVNYHGNSSVHQITKRNVKLNDSGLYLAIIYNIETFINIQLNLTVLTEPNVKIRWSFSNGGETINLSCDADLANASRDEVYYLAWTGCPKIALTDSSVQTTEIKRSDTRPHVCSLLRNGSVVAKEEFRFNNSLHGHMTFQARTPKVQKSPAVPAVWTLTSTYVKTEQPDLPPILDCVVLDRKMYRANGFEYDCAANVTPAYANTTKIQDKMNSTIFYITHVVTKNNVSDNDEQDYLFFVTDKEQYTSYQLHLVHSPIVEVEKSNLKYKVFEENATVTIDWNIYRLENPDKDFVHSSFGDGEETKLELINSENSNIMKARVTFMARMTENLTLTAENEGGLKGSATTLICVSDGPHELTETASPALFQVTEGENVTLTCRVSTCNYKNRIDWFYSMNGDRSRKELKANDTINGTYSYTSIISFVKVASGVYYCKAEPLQLECDLCAKERKFEIAYKGKDALTRRIVGTILLVLVASLFILLVTVIVLFCLRNRAIARTRNEEALLKLTSGDYESINKELSLSEQAYRLPFNVKWGFPSDRLRMGHQIGSGNYGVVFSATAFGIVKGEKKTQVAVKMAKALNDPHTMNLMISELKVMAHLGKQAHIVNLLGAVIDKIAQQQLMIIVELCPYGNLNNYLIENRYRFVNDLSASTLPRRRSDQKGHGTMPFNLQVLISWSFQVSKGMEWLACHKIVHGDLAARNILLTTGNIVKICDFGLAQNLYNEYVKEMEKDKTRLPVMWMAIESVKDGKFSTKSDVWSYGIAVWEIFSLGAMPYTEFESFRELWRNLQKGYRLEKPAYAPESMYTNMLSCWKENPCDRPNFSDLSEDIFSVMDDSAKENYATEIGKIYDFEEIDVRNIGDRGSQDLDLYQDVTAETSCFPRPYSYIDTIELKPLTN